MILNLKLKIIQIILIINERLEHCLNLRVLASRKFQKGDRVRNETQSQKKNITTTTIWDKTKWLYRNFYEKKDHVSSWNGAKYNPLQLFDVLQYGKTMGESTRKSSLELRTINWKLCGWTIWGKYGLLANWLNLLWNKLPKWIWLYPPDILWRRNRSPSAHVTLLP